VLVDNGSLADILYYLAFQQMRINKEHLLPSDTLLVGFGGTKVFPVGTITLLVTIRTYPPQLTKEVIYLPHIGEVPIRVWDRRSAWRSDDHS